jgi:cytochrome d ubiquinol oxidase subunit I
MIGTTFAMYMAMYIALTIAYVSVVFYLARKAQYAASPAPSFDRGRVQVAMK